MDRGGAVVVKKGLDLGGVVLDLQGKVWGVA